MDQNVQNRCVPVDGTSGRLTPTYNPNKFCRLQLGPRWGHTEGTASRFNSTVSRFDGFIRNTPPHYLFQNLNLTFRMKKDAAENLPPFVGPIKEEEEEEYRKPI